MAAQIQIRRDTAAAWTAADPTLASGEFGYEINTGKMKIGDGATQWTLLAYWSTGGGGITGSGTAGTLSVFTGATAIGDSAAIQVAGITDDSLPGIGINLSAAEIGGGWNAAPFALGETPAQVGYSKPLMCLLDRDHAATGMTGTGPLIRFLNYYHHATAPAPFALGELGFVVNGNPTTTSTRNADFLLMCTKSGAKKTRLTIGYNSVFRLYNDNTMTADELTAYAFLPGEFAQIYPMSGGGGLRIEAALKNNSRQTAISLTGYAGLEPTSSVIEINACKWDGGTDVEAFADATEIFSARNNGNFGMVLFGNGDFSAHGKIGSIGGTEAPASYYLHVSQLGAVNVNTDFAALENLYYDCAMLATETGLLFRQSAYNGGAGLPLDAARISFKCDDTWATTSTESGSLNFWSISLGVLGRKLSINALGALYGYCPAVVQSLTANEQTAFGCGSLDTYHISPVTQQGGLFSSAFVAAASVHNCGFEWLSLMGLDPTSGNAAHVFNASLHDGAGALTVLADAAGLLVVKNNGTPKFTVAGNGDIAWTGAATGVIDGGGA